MSGLGWDLVPSLSGLTAGTVGVLISHPFDTVKTRIQAGWSTRGHAVLSTTLQEQGIHGLYRGILPPLLSVGLVQAATFTIYQHMKNALDGKVQCQTFLAGLVSGAIPSFFTLPSYYVKVQLQNEKVLLGLGFCGEGGIADTVEGRRL